jgi:hypothetical protein
MSRSRSGSCCACRSRAWLTPDRKPKIQRNGFASIVTICGRTMIASPMCQAVSAGEMPPSLPDLAVTLVPIRRRSCAVSEAVTRRCMVATPSRLVRLIDALPVQDADRRLEHELQSLNWCRIHRVARAHEPQRPGKGFRLIATFGGVCWRVRARPSGQQQRKQGFRGHSHARPYCCIAPNVAV